MNFVERLRQEVIVGDGATGTLLYNRGISLEANFEHLNLVKPALVLELHGDYIAAGARLIETNTFGANATKLGAIGLGHKVREINLAGARLARQAAEGKGVIVAGSVGPLLRIKGDERELTPGETEDIFAAQCQALAEGGVELLLLETFTDLPQLKHALAAARGTNLPVVASMAFAENGRLNGGVEAEQAVQELALAGAAMVGANCGAGPLEILKVLRRMAAVTDLPLAAFPNSGFPEYVEGRYIYRATPSYFADMALEMVAAGATLIGGCCGTTPEHISALAARLAGVKPSPRPRPSVTARPQPQPSRRTSTESFLDRWGKEPIVTVELDPPRGLDCSKVLAGSRRLQEAGAAAINLAENPLARVRLANIPLAHLIQEEVGIEVIAHVTCRDRNLLGLQSDLMGASLLGIRHILAVTGDPARIGEHAGATSVYDVNSFGLIKLLDDLNRGVNASGASIGGSTELVIGCAFNPNSPRMSVQVERLEKKVANGARFVQTQPLYEISRLHEMLDRCSHLNVPILPGILPLVSERNAEFLHNEVPGIVIPDEIRQRMRGKEKEEGAAEGLAIAREFIDACRHLVGGFYLIPPFGRIEVALELIRHIRG
ncbi:MAG TPA: bifunctional homocysteine S-methyltransferase/methylenetetrahydrofolate reductase [Geobacterales bacterium]|nr:bifunctional homocysteine S-methyltransferase/methylenetetrahydrofolate reductase [Geobacterales bacterium]